MNSRERKASRMLLAAALLLSFLISATVHFTRVAEFGLYEDDYWAIAPHLGRSIGSLGAALGHEFSVWADGRPLNHFLPTALATVGSALAGLRGVYLLAAAWLALNGFLVFLIARRLASPRAALIALVTYLLYPADSTKILLTHAAHIQGAMTFLLLAAWLWLRDGRQRLASYPVASLTLLAYEATILPFVALPLLAPPRQRPLRAWLLHLGSCGLMVGMVAWIRHAIGDSRLATANHQLGESVRRSLSSLWLGPATSATSLLRSALVGARALDLRAVCAVAVLWLGLGAAWWAARAAGARSAGIEPADGKDHPPWWRLLLGALVTWSASYLLTVINYPPTQIVGRLTSTHVTAGFPAALAVAALFDGLRRGGRWRQLAVTGTMAVWFGLLVSYHHLLQEGYVEAWQGQRYYWRQVMELTPEVGPGWSVIVVGTPAPPNPVIFAYSWADYFVYKECLGKAFDPDGPRFAHLGHVGWAVKLQHEGGKWLWRPSFWEGPFVPIDPHRLVLLQDSSGRLRRVEGIETSAGALRSMVPPPGDGRRTWPDTEISRLLFPEQFALK